MEKAQLDALLAAHGGRAQPVASLHVLRAPAIGGADHAFLAEHAASLATIDLSRWLDHASAEQRPDVLEALVSLAEREPSRFEHEIARAPHFRLRSAERTELIIRLVGRAPESLIAALSPDTAAHAASPHAAHAISPHGALADSAHANSFAVGPAHAAEVALPAGAAAPETFFDPSEILGELDFGADVLGEMDPGADVLGRAAAPPATDDLGDLLGGSLLGDEDLQSAPDFLSGPGGHSAAPELTALLADLASAKAPRARTAWKKRALAAARAGAEDWGPSVTRLPSALRDAVLVRAASSPRAEERAALLEWLLQNGGRRAQLVELTASLLSLGDGARGVRDWLAQSWAPRLLPDKAAWSRHGTTLLSALADQRAYSEMDELFAAVTSGAAALGPGLLSMPSAAAAPPLQGPISAALASMLLSATGAALAAGRRKEALAAAAALACLGAPSKDRASLATLRRKKAAKGEVATLLSLAESRARRPRDVPRLEDLVAAVHVLSDAMS